MEIVTLLRVYEATGNKVIVTFVDGVAVSALQVRFDGKIKKCDRKFDIPWKELVDEFGYTVIA